VSANITKQVKQQLTIEPKVGFSRFELVKIDTYVTAKGQVPLPPQVAQMLFESYLNGSSISDICKMYSEYDNLAIHYTAYHYDWPLNRDELTIDMQDRIKQKLLNSKMQQLELVDGMIKVAHIEAMNAIRSYIKHPCDKNIPKIFRIKSIKELSDAITMMGNIVGQDNIKKVEMIKKDVAATAEDEKRMSSESRQAHKDANLSEKTAKELLSALNKDKS